MSWIEALIAFGEYAREKENSVTEVYNKQKQHRIFTRHRSSTLPQSFIVVVLLFSRKTHHVFDFSSSVFHSIFIVAVLFLFVLFVVGLHQENKNRKTREKVSKSGEFSFEFFTFSFACFF